MDAMDVAQNIGLRFPRRTRTPKDVEDRLYLQYAVNKANLNVSERLAINEAFYPNGGGFDLFQKGAEEANAVIYSNGTNDFQDTFTRELLKMKVPDGVAYRVKTQKSDKGNFETNLAMAISKLKEVIGMDK